MVLMEIRNLTKKDIPLYYRNEYSGEAVFQVTGKESSTAIEIVVEKSPLGHPDIRIQFLENFDWPLVPAMKQIKEFIRNEIEKGVLF